MKRAATPDALLFFATPLALHRACTRESSCYPIVVSLIREVIYISPLELLVLVNEQVFTA